MQLDLLLGNETIKHSIKTALEAKKLPHALLLCAQNGCGRGFAARCIAADYLYPKNPTAAKSVMQQQSPELIVVQGEGKSGQISIESIRTVRTDIFLSALSAEGRVVWIKDAHKMAAPAANALLKVLEEPPNNVVFILSAENSSSLPVTIRSRCAMYSISPLPLLQCEEFLYKNLPANADKRLPALLAALYGGRLGMGLKALQDPDRLAVVYDALRLAKAAAANNRYELLRVFSAYEGRKDDDRPRRNNLLSDFIAALNSSLEGVTNGELPAIPPGVAARLLVPILSAQSELSGNAAPKLLFAALTARLCSPDLQ